MSEVEQYHDPQRLMVPSDIILPVMRNGEDTYWRIHSGNYYGWWVYHADESDDTISHTDTFEEAINVVNAAIYG